MPGRHEVALGTGWGGSSLLVCWTQTCSVHGAGSFALGAAVSCVRGGTSWSHSKGHFAARGHDVACLIATNSAVQS